MTNIVNFNHKSVLLNECIDGLNIKPDGIYVDGTLGGGGHSLEIAKKLNGNGTLIAIDQDLNALTYAKTVLSDFTVKDINTFESVRNDRFTEEDANKHPATVQLVKNNFSNLDNILQSLNVTKISGILLDLGVSSHQLDEKERGFSYMQDAPLDMRMDQTQDFSAFDIVNNYDENSLIRIIKSYGEERWATRIAKFIISKRAESPINTTLELVDIIKKAVPSSVSNKGSHPAKKTFQAIRIEVNKELDIIEDTINCFVDFLEKDARACVITFHSLEDRIVKNTFRKFEKPCTCPPDFPICICGLTPQLKLINRKPIVASTEELDDNSRSKSAKLRVAQKI